ncbi:MAG: hypothetical protein ACRD0P_20535 [Stackebrandtia sp.]
MAALGTELAIADVPHKPQMASTCAPLALAMFALTGSWRETLPRPTFGPWALPILAVVVAIPVLWFVELFAGQFIVAAETIIGYPPVADSKRWAGPMAVKGCALGFGASICRTASIAPGRPGSRRSSRTPTATLI